MIAQRRCHRRDITGTHCGAKGEVGCKQARAFFQTVAILVEQAKEDAFADTKLLLQRVASNLIAGPARQQVTGTPAIQQAVPRTAQSSAHADLPARTSRESYWYAAGFAGGLNFGRRGATSMVSVSSLAALPSTFNRTTAGWTTLLRVPDVNIVIAGRQGHQCSPCRRYRCDQSTACPPRTHRRSSSREYCGRWFTSPALSNRTSKGAAPE